MATTKEEHLALTSGISLVGVATTNFYEYGRIAFESFREEIIDSIIKPNKFTALHWYLTSIQDISKELEYIDESEILFDVIQ